MAVEPQAHSVDVTCFLAPAGAEVAQACTLAEALDAIEKTKHHVWINMLSPTHEEFAVVARRLDLHELAVEDVFSPHSHAKVEPYAGHLFSVIPALNLSTPDDLFDVVNLNAFLGKHYVLTAQRAPLPAVANAKNWLNHKSDALRRGPDFLLYVLLDGIVDEYLELSDHMNNQVDKLEERIFGIPDRSVAAAIFDLRHKAAWLRRMISPQREILNILTNRPQEFVQRDTQLYLRDVYDHVQRVRENSETLHDLLQGAMDTYLTLVANRTNDVMKILAAVGTIVLPINMLTGLYGTNFDVLPGATNPTGFWVFCAALAVVAGAMVVIFRSRKWF